MLQPYDVLYGSKYTMFSTDLDRFILQRMVSWLWLAPPCSSFSPLRNLDRGGPLRPIGKPEGDEQVPEVKRGNDMWYRALDLCELILTQQGYFVVEHPLNSKAWQLPRTQYLLSQPGVRLLRIDQCMYHGDEVGTRKPTRLMTNAPWVPIVCLSCDGRHEHGPMLRGARAAQASAYPWGLCRALAAALRAWLDGLHQ